MSRTVGWLLLAALAAGPPLALAAGQPFYVDILTRLVCLAAAATSLNLILGHGGMISFGHAAYIGIGAYAVGIPAYYGLYDGWLHLVLAVACSALFALATGAVALRTRGVYFIMITMAFAQMMFFAVVSIEESLQQFYDLLDSPQAARILLNEENGVRGAFIEQGETHIELLQPLRTDSVIGRFLDRHGEGIHHMAFTVDDVDAKARELEALGIPIITGPREGFTGRIAFADPASMHGALIEFVTPFER